MWIKGGENSLYIVKSRTVEVATLQPLLFHDHTVHLYYVSRHLGLGLGTGVV